MVDDSSDLSLRTTGGAVGGGLISVNVVGVSAQAMLEWISANIRGWGEQHNDVREMGERNLLLKVDASAIDGQDDAGRLVWHQRLVTHDAAQNYRSISLCHLRLIRCGGSCPRRHRNRRRDAWGRGRWIRVESVWDVSARRVQ